MASGVIDESVIDPGEGDGAYFIAAAIVIESPERLRTLVLERLSRQRPFHWMDDRRPVVRERFLSLAISEQINVVVAYELLDGLGGKEPAHRRARRTDETDSAPPSARPFSNNWPCQRLMSTGVGQSGASSRVTG